MASGTKLSMVFLNSAGDEITYGYNYVKADTTAQQATTLMTAMIENGDIFASAPVTIKSAKLITTTETPLEI